MRKIRKGDEVLVISGRDKGKNGVILSVVKNGERLLIDGINTVKKHVKADPNSGDRGGIVTKSLSIHRSNVMLHDKESGKRSRVGIKILEDGKKVRYLKSTDNVIDI
ncbi:50S ribosomal protein L24 [Gammaproteobacteria bacterium]|nr:50S ribosomal protein L24 [Gammaproteobacteria bacterium]